MKKYVLTFMIALIAVASHAFAGGEYEYGVFKTKDDFINQKLTMVGQLLPSDNFNVGELKVQLKDRTVIQINCLHEHYYGFKYVDGNDYVLVDGVFARAVIIGNANLLISPKASFKVDENGKYTFTPAPNGALSFYFVRDLDKKTSSKFERAIADDKELLEKYKNDKETYPDTISKQIKYLLMFNDKPQKDNKKSKSKSKASGKKHKH